MLEHKVFLIQCAGRPAHHGIVNYNDRSFADELVKYGYYHYEWYDVSEHGPTKSYDREMGLVHQGDKIIQYCDSAVPYARSCVRFVYEVVGLSHLPPIIIAAARASGTWDPSALANVAAKPRIIWLKQIHELQRPVTYQEIKKVLGPSGVLSNRMHKFCGWQGFNIGEVEAKDISYVLSR